MFSILSQLPIVCSPLDIISSVEYSLAAVGADQYGDFAQVTVAQESHGVGGDNAGEHGETVNIGAGTEGSFIVFLLN